MAGAILGATASLEPPPAAPPAPAPAPVSVRSATSIASAAPPSVRPRQRSSHN
jgi:hypothetical protein